MTHILFVVSRNHRELLQGLQAKTRGQKVEIVLDRRRRERRQKSDPISSPERRSSDRRTRSISRDLDLIGIAVVVLP